MLPKWITVFEEINKCIKEECKNEKGRSKKVCKQEGSADS